MHEPITLVRRRQKDGKPGDWEILVGPELPLMQHLDANKKIVAQFPTHEEFAAIRVARLEDVTRTIVFKTKAELKAEAEAHAKFAAKAAQSSQDAATRQAKLNEEQARAEAALKQAKLADMNKMHDAIREQGKK